MGAHGDDGARGHPPSAKDVSWSECSTGAARCDLHVRPEHEEADPLVDKVGPKKKGSATRLHQTIEGSVDVWHRAIDPQVGMMRGITAGQPLNVDAMTQQLREIDSPHATWMEMVLRRDERARASSI